MMPHNAIADAASVVMLRGSGQDAQVLMGQRAANAAFMPRKFVFPGGRVDAEDASVSAAPLLALGCRSALQVQVNASAYAPNALPDVLQNAALRELHEETGLQLARPRPAALRFVFRAITPPGRPRRFDARFFLADADDFDGDHITFAHASGELSQLQWLSIREARGMDLPFITQVILAEVAQGAADRAANPVTGVPFFDNSGPTPCFSRL